MAQTRKLPGRFPVIIPDHLPQIYSLSSYNEDRGPLDIDHTHEYNVN